MANYTQYIPQINSTTYPVSITNCFTALTTDVTVLENSLALKLNLTGGAMTGAITNFTSTGIDDSASTGNAITIDASNHVTLSGNMYLTGTVDGRDLSVDGAKLDLIEDLADVTDTANVTAAGALMDSEVDADLKTLSLPANTTISTFGASFIDDIDAAAAIVTLGITATATEISYTTDVTSNIQAQLNLKAPLASPTFTGTVELADAILSRAELKDYSVTHSTPSSSAGAITFDYSVSQSFAVTLTENITSVTLSNPPASGSYGEIVIEFIQDTTGNWAVTWPASVDWPGGTPPTITTTPSTGKDKIFLSTHDGGTTWSGEYSQDYS